MGGRSAYFLAFDFGTESVRGGIFDIEGKLVATEYKTYPTYFPNPGWAEQNPNEWWQSFIEVSRKLVNNQLIKKEEIKAISVDTTSCTVLALDKRFNPLRNAIIWMDVRASNQAERIEEVSSDSLKYNGFGNVSAEWMPCKALWIKENEPEVYASSKYICAFQDWVNYRLTGNYVGSINNVTVRWYYNSDGEGWPLDFYKEIGLEDIIPKFPPKILKLGEVVGNIKKEVADEMGLNVSIPVVQGGADAYIGMLGLDVVKPGRVAFITGSSHLLLGLSDTEFHKRGIFGTFPDALIPGSFVVEGGQISTGSIMKWFKDNYINCEIDKAAKKEGVSIYDYMSNKAKDIPPGSEGLILLDYWQGNRTPLTDPKARGVIWGLSLKHTPFHMYRAIMEGVAYGTEHIRRYFKEAGFEPEKIYACGGATQSDLWMQIHSDVLGLPIYITEESNAPLLGDAVLSAFGSRYYSSIEEAASKMVRVKKVIEPNLENTFKYKYFVDKYIDTYPLLKDLMHNMVEHIEKSNLKDKI